MDMNIVYWIAGAVLFLIVFLLVCYVKTAPNIAYVISGRPRKTPKFLVGTGGLRIPGLQQKDKLYLGQLSVDIKAKKIPTKDFINVDVDAVAKVRIDPTMLSEASANFLNKNEEQIAASLKDSLEGNMREIVGTLELKELNLDRDGFSNQIQKKAAEDMKKLGIEILTCNIQSITDETGLIQDLGADNTYMIKKNASINKANAERDIKIATAEAAKAANDAEVLAQTQIAEKNNELAIRKANLKSESDKQLAIANAAYKIQEQEQQLEINVKTVDAEAAKQIRTQEQQKVINSRAVEAQVERAKKEQELREQEIAIQQKTLEATVNKQAEADKFKKETDAAAALEQRKREAEAIAYEAEMEAKAKKAMADADLFKAQQEAAAVKARGEAEAAAIRVKGEAEATAIQAKGEAEAAAMDKKAEALKKYGNAALAKMAFDVLPQVAKEVAQPLASIDSVQVYGTNGNEAAGISGNVPVVIKQTMDTIKSATGVDLGNIIQEKSSVVAATLNK